MKQPVRPILTTLILVLMGISITVKGVFAEKQDSDSLPLLELQTFAEVFDQIKKSYVEEVDDKKLLQLAVEGMLIGLDPHSAYLDPEHYEDLRISTKGEFGGLGIEVTMEDGFVKVVAPIDDTPAERAGVQPGDLVIKLDESPVKGMTLREAVDHMRGKVGTEIVLTIVRQGEETPIKLSIERAVIKVKSVKSRLIDDTYGYIRISQFQVNTGNTVEEHIEQLNKSSKKQLKGIILDLRNNPGGVLKAAVDVSDLFLEDGLVVYTEGRIKNSQMKFEATESDVLDHAPMVILVNGGSASASEIVAGALQDHKRAIVMGTKTFGKGSVQTVLPLKNDRALKLTTALYYTPNGRSIQAEGIVPDIKVEALKINKHNGDALLTYKEADLKGHLSNGNGKEESTQKTMSKEEIDNQTLLENDYQLNEALNVLKAISLSEMRKAS